MKESPNPIEFSGMRRATGLTVEQFASALNPQQPADPQDVLAWECGDQPIPPEIADSAARVVCKVNELAAICVTSVKDNHDTQELPTLLTYASDCDVLAWWKNKQYTAAMHQAATFKALALLWDQGIKLTVTIQPSTSEPLGRTFANSADFRDELRDLIQDDGDSRPDNYYSTLEDAVDSFENYLHNGHVDTTGNKVYLRPQVDLPTALDQWRSGTWHVK